MVWATWEAPTVGFLFPNSGHHALLICSPQTPPLLKTAAEFICYLLPRNLSDTPEKEGGSEKSLEEMQKQWNSYRDGHMKKGS